MLAASTQIAYLGFTLKVYELSAVDGKVDKKSF